MIFAAYDTHLELPVALKLLHGRATLAYIKHEFRILAGLQHPNLVRLHDLVVEGARGWFSMELIEGDDFVAAHAAARAAGPEALRRRFGELAPALLDALRTVHGAGFLHGDLKPANVLVDASGRAVLLDFGMSSEIGLDDRLADPADVGGTLAYLPPEAVSDPRPTLAWDTYALGLLFFEALTGCLPFGDDLSRALVAKRDGLPADARRRLEAASPELAGCVCAMLRGRPDARPSLSEVALRVDERSSGRAAVTQAAAGRELVGRDEQLAELRRWSGERGLSVCTVRGASGIGKSSLARALLRELRASGQLVLTARCHPCESVPFNGLDKILDDLVRCVSQEEVAVDAALLRHLAAVFPAFARLTEAVDAGPADDAGETLGRALEALRALVAALARRHRITMWIDDVQWADGETLKVLRDWSGASEPPGVHLLLTTRAEVPAGVRVDRAFVLSPLVHSESALLVRGLAPELTAETVAALCAEAAGNPYILQRLARGAAEGRGDVASSLADALTGALAQVPGGETAALLLALAGRPLDLDLLAASGVRRWVPAELERRGVAVRSADGRDRFELQHDRLAAVLLSGAADARMSAGHASLAAALVARGSDDDAPHVATHLHASGSADAAMWASRAGERFAAAYALESAAEWHRRALEWTAEGDPAGHGRRRALAEALVAAGRAEEAGDVFVACASGTAEPGAGSLLQRAAEAYLGAGIAGKGMVVLRPLLAARHITWPATPASAAAGILLRLARVAVRGALPGATRAPSEHAVDLDLCWAAAKGLLGTDAVRGAFYALEGLDRARDEVDARRHARHLAAVAAIVLAPLGGRMAALGRRWIDRAARTAEGTKDPYLAGFVLVCKGQLAVIDGQWEEARAASASGVELLRSSPGIHAHWEQTIGVMGLLRALQELREFEALSAEATRLRVRAEATGDLYAEVTGRLYEAIGLLAQRRTAEARAQVARALERWGRREALDIQQLYAVHILAVCDVVEDDPAGAWGRVCAAWPRWERSQLLRIPVARIDCLALRARVALCAAARAGGRERAALLAACRNDARRLRGEGREDARSLGVELSTASIDLDVAITRLFHTNLRAPLEEVDDEIDLVTCVWRRRE